MKRQIKNTLGILFILAIFSCEKDSMTSSTSTSKSTSQLTDFFNSVKPENQTFSITAGQYKTIMGAKGTKISFLPNSFKKKNGTVVTSGTVNIVLQEMLVGGDMILANKTTTSNGKLLISGGQFYIKAYQNNEELLINKEAKPTVSIPAKTNQPMSLFIGTVRANDSISGDSTINWNTDTTTVTTVQDTASSSLYYNFTLDSMTYINCDYFMNSSATLTDVQVVMPNTSFVDSNTAVFIYFPSTNAVARMYTFTKSTKTFNLGTYYRLPEGFNVKIVIVSKIGSQMYFEVLNKTIVTNLSVNANPTPSTLSAIKTAISTL